MRKYLPVVIALFACVLLAGSAQAQSGHDATASWSASPDAAGNPTLTYDVFKAIGACPASGVPATVSKVANVATLTFKDTAVSVGQSYCYYIVATLNGGSSSASNVAGGTIPIAPASGVTVVVH